MARFFLQIIENYPGSHQLTLKNFLTLKKFNLKNIKSKKIFQLFKQKIFNTWEFKNPLTSWHTSRITEFC